MKKYTPSDEDKALFREAIGEVKKIKPTATVAPIQKRPKRILVKQPVFIETGVLDASHHLEPVASDEKLFFSQKGLPPLTLRELKRGQITIQAALDLHNMTISEAEQALYHFLKDCVEAGIRGVRIVHGKGLSNPTQQPILKNQVNNWLRHHACVLAFASAPSKDGGTGAVYVWLKK